MASGNRYPREIIHSASSQIFFQNTLSLFPILSPCQFTSQKLNRIFHPTLNTNQSQSHKILTLLIPTHSHSSTPFNQIHKPPNRTPPNFPSQSITRTDVTRPPSGGRRKRVSSIPFGSENPRSRKVSFKARDRSGVDSTRHGSPPFSTIFAAVFPWPWSPVIIPRVCGRGPPINRILLETKFRGTGWTHARSFLDFPSRFPSRPRAAKRPRASYTGAELARLGTP